MAYIRAGIKRVDENQREIVRSLRAIGASVQDLSAVGQGCPDILVGFQGKTFLVEIKHDKGKLNADQVRWHAEWRGETHVIRSVQEAFKLLGAVCEGT